MRPAGPAFVNVWLELPTPAIIAHSPFVRRTVELNFRLAKIGIPLICAPVNTLNSASISTVISLMEWV